MSLKGFSSEQLSALEKSLMDGSARGVRFSLADVRSEMRRRQPGRRFDPRVIAATIIQQARASQDGCTTYGQLWKQLTGGSDWVGNASQSTMGRELGRLIAYCHQNGLPILSTLVVRQNQGVLSDAAVNAICEDCIKLGIEVGPDRNAFVSAQATASRQVVAEQLPDA
jgi:hypothetical protein